MQGFVVSGLLRAFARPCKLSLVIVESLLAGIGRADRQDWREIVSPVRHKVLPSLVNIRVITVRDHDGKEHKGQAAGSRRINSPEGRGLTNCLVSHVKSGGHTFKPRQLCVSARQMFAGMGRPVFARKGDVVGVLVTQEPESDPKAGNPMMMMANPMSMQESFAGLILPADKSWVAESDKFSPSRQQANAPTLVN